MTEKINDLLREYKNELNYIDDDAKVLELGSKIQILYYIKGYLESANIAILPLLEELIDSFEELESQGKNLNIILPKLEVLNYLKGYYQ